MCDNVLFLPYFSGERTPIHDPSAKGCWFGLNLTHSRGDVFRALLDGKVDVICTATSGRLTGQGPTV